MRKLITYILLLFPLIASAQVGEYRNLWSVGVNGHYNLAQTSFLPRVPQAMHGGMGGGFVVRYTSERYINMICSVQVELNYSQYGWKEEYLDSHDKTIMHPTLGEPLDYQRTLNYIQFPIFAHLAYGKEKSGVNVFLNLGPQFGYLLSESTSTNLDAGTLAQAGVKQCTQQQKMPAENTFDYGIAGGGGVEVAINHFGRLQLEARYYYGLGNIYGNSKRDYFGNSNHQVITIKAAYLIDLGK